jgi:hypothetical protein
MEFVTRAVKIEAEEIMGIEASDSHAEHKYVITDTRRTHMLKGEPAEKVVVGDYLNVTDPSYIYHVPRRFFHGCNRKYDRVVK